MNENTVSVIIGLSVAVCVLALVAAPVACSISSEQAIVEMVKAGHAPADARCAVAGASNASREAVCVLRAIGKDVK
ncbi:MAG: hypothetical protein K9K38_03705 [Rhodoferax sp.]|nr:hypothetical protein [Rhodoferax sp.]